MDDDFSNAIFRASSEVWWALAFAVKEVQQTPNPNAAKFVLDGPITDRPTSFFNAVSAQDHPVASRLFAIKGVSSVLLLGDFVTVNKSPDAVWSEIASKVKQVLASS
ncbi:MAG: NifU N-terminal domain-containing protein [Tepidisphaeraceae bacterium]|jgi:hypothetical protein